MTLPGHPRRVAALTLSLGVAAATVAAAGAPAAATVAGERPTVAVSTPILADVVAAIGGDAVEVISVMPAGVDPHDFQPSAAEAAELEQADLVIVNGLGLEQGIESNLESAAAAGIPVVELGPLVDPLPLDEHGEHDSEHENDDHDHDSGFDPHFWTDPQRMLLALEVIEAELADLDPDSAGEFAANADAYAADLSAVDDALAERFAAIPDGERTIVTSHEVLGYFAARYDLDVVGTIVASSTTLSAPSVAELADLVGTVDESGATVIVVSSTENHELADTVAAEATGEVSVVAVQLESLGEPDSPSGTYLGMLDAAGTTIADALSA